MDAQLSDNWIRTALERLEERPLGDHPAEVQEVFADIRETLRIPWEGLLFRFLARDPALLRDLWAAIREPLSTRWAEREAVRIAESAIVIVPHPDLGAAHRTALARGGVGESAMAQIEALHRTAHYVFAKLLMVAAAGALLLGGYGGGAPERTGADREPVPRGVPEGASRLEPLTGDGIPAPTRKRLEALRVLHGHPLNTGYFRRLARWPVLLGRAREDLGLIVGTGRHRATVALLSGLAEVAARSCLEPARLGGEGKLPLDVARNLFVSCHQRLLPDLLIDAAWFRLLMEGEHSARALPLAAV